MRRVLLALIAVLLFASPVWALPARVGSGFICSDNSASAHSAITCTSLSTSAGDFFVFGVYTTSSAARVISSITDGSSLCGVAWKTHADHASLVFGSTAGSQEFAYCYNTNTVSTVSVTITFDNAIGNGTLVVAQEYSGTNTTADPFDSAPAGNANTGSPGTSLTVSAPSVAHSLLLTMASIFNSTDGVTWSGGPSSAKANDNGASIGTSTILGDVLDYNAGATIGATSTHTGSELAQVAFVVKAASAAPSSPCTRMLLGVGCDARQ